MRPRVGGASHEMQFFAALQDCQNNICNAGSLSLAKDFGTKYDSASMQRDIATVKANDVATKVFKCMCTQCVDKGHGVFKSWPLYPVICTAVGAGDSQGVCEAGSTDYDYPIRSRARFFMNILAPYIHNYQFIKRKHKFVMSRLVYVRDC